MNKKIRELAENAGFYVYDGEIFPEKSSESQTGFLEKFAELIVKECIDKIETYHIPVGNSAAGEMACEWTYDALKEISDEIKERFGIE